MQHADGFFHLTYCTNIHPGVGWDQVFGNLNKYAPPLKANLSPNAPFGIGLRLSSDESVELLEGDNLPSFKQWLGDNGFYVALINGFPYGSFHNRVIKQDVFAPDWRSEDRVSYTLRLVEILAQLLPAGLDGGISTSPLSYKAWIPAGDDASWQTMTFNVVKVAQAMAIAKRDHGVFIHLDIEPEPDGLIENGPELIEWYRKWLLPFGTPLLAETPGVSEHDARAALLDHVQLCFDTCHFSIEYEDAEDAFERFDREGIKIGRYQISSALRVPLPDETAVRAELGRQLATFVEPTYLHQVIERGADGTLRHHSDLALALPHIQNPDAKEWRIHYHVPMFAESYQALGSTRHDIEAVSEYLRKKRFTRHLEIETYTWDILPAELKDDLGRSIEREYRWVMGALGLPPVHGGGDE